ncbi:MAG: molecular chaperone TorD family protein [Actinomycetota bacterium]|nr:molecular chaperone TorD family protein [Actinomycetota bacterium]
MTDWADIARTRQGLYRFLGGALLSPSAEMFDVLAQAIGVLEQRDIDMFAFSRDLRRLGRHFPADVAGDRLDVDYIRLFASGRSGALSPPTESYYRVPAKGGGIAEFVAEMQREYRSMGIGSVGLDEAPDHISTELEVMAYLCDLEAGAWMDEQTRLAGEVLDLEIRFLRRHLAGWVPLLQERVHAAQPTAFYRDLVDTVHSFVVHDKDYVRLIRDGIAE